jgi:hypothetical protein
MEEKVKKVELMINGNLVKVMPHMIDDLMLLGATTVKKVAKETPKELIKAKVLPEMVITPKVEEVKLDEPVKTRKKPVRSKT